MTVSRSARVRSALSRGATALVAVGCVTAGLVAPAGAADGSREHLPGQRLVAQLSGEKEVPGPGDPNGTGVAKIRLRPWVELVCASVTWDRIGMPMSAHIHKGIPGVSGDVVVDLTGSVTGGRHCTRAPRGLIREILNHPRRYYFNVHNERFPAGAIRGQLHPPLN